MSSFPWCQVVRVLLRAGCDYNLIKVAQCLQLINNTNSKNWSRNTLICSPPVLLTIPDLKIALSLRKLKTAWKINGCEVSLGNQSKPRRYCKIRFQTTNQNLQLGIDFQKGEKYSKPPEIALISQSLKQRHFLRQIDAFRISLSFSALILSRSSIYHYCDIYVSSEICSGQCR